MTPEQMRKSGYLRIFASYYKPHLAIFLLDMLCALGISLVDLAFPLVSRYAMQHMLPQRLFGLFFAVMAALLLAYLLKGIFYFIVTYWATCWGCASRRTSAPPSSPTCRICPSPSTTRTAPVRS